MATTPKTAYITSNLEVLEQLSLATLSDKSVTHQLKDELVLTSSSTPDFEKVWSARQLLTAGAATIDLKALTDPEGNTITTEGKKIRAIKIKALSTNANALTISEGASNGYELFGNAFTIALEAGDHFLAYLGTNAPDISDTTKNIDLAGTGTQGIDIIIVIG